MTLRLAQRPDWPTQYRVTWHGTDLGSLHHHGMGRYAGELAYRGDVWMTDENGSFHRFLVDSVARWCEGLDRAAQSMAAE